jgi:fused signal recognition particle receptor
MSKLFSWFKKDSPSTSDQKEQTQDETLQKEGELANEPIEQNNDSDEAIQLQASATETASDDVLNGTQDKEVIELEIEKTEAEIEGAENTQDNSTEQSETAVVLKNETSAQANKPSLFARLKSSLARTKANIGSGFSSFLLGKSIDDELYEELETQLLLADVGMTTTNKIIDELTQNAKSSQLKDGEALSKILQDQMQTILDKVNQPLDFDLAKDEQGNKQPFVILMVGVNGVGKTTTIGKLAKQFQADGKRVMLAAGDTFRAAAVEQLQVWGERNDIPVVAQHTGADSASVIFDAIASAQAKNADVLIADTAGRLQNKDNLIEELKKVVRVMKKLIPNAPHEIMLTLDASTGQNAVSQTRIFNKAVGITGINLTKLDGSAKGGVIFALADEFAIPVRYIGIGEGIDDLREFESKAFVDALFAD